MPLLVPRPEESAAAARLLERARIGARPYLVIAPGARFGPAKRWPPERFAAAAAAVSATTGAAVVLVGEAADAPATQAVRAKLPGAIDFTAATRLDTLVGLLAGSLGVVANDSGTMHLAAALGRPVVGLFGSSNPNWTRPLGPRSTAVLHAVSCSPCYRQRCNRDFGCLLGVAPETVAARFAALLDIPPPDRLAGGPG
jgi:heptosyltransferase-2